MENKKLIFSTRGNIKKIDSDKDDNIVSLSLLRDWVKSGRGFFHLFRYREVVLYVYRLDVIGKPFTTFVALKLLSHHKTSVIDGDGHTQNITVVFLCQQFVSFINEMLTVRRFLKKIETEVSKLSVLVAEDNKNKACCLSDVPVYLRTDLWFDVSSGGSVGHIAGVLNQLDKLSTKPCFLTTDVIPTVSSDIETILFNGKIDYWNFRELPSLSSNSAFYQWALRVLKRKKISFIYQRYSLNNYSGVVLANFFNVPFVLEYNGSEIWINKHWGSSLKYEKLSEKIEILNFQAADLIVVVSQVMKNELIKRGVESQKILVNPNGVDPDKYAPTIKGEVTRKKLQISNEQLVFGFIGTFGNWHGAEVLAEAFAMLVQHFPEYRKRLKLMLIGDGQTLPQVKAILKSYQVEKESILTGLVSQDSGPSYLAACDILVSPHVPNPDGSPFFGSPTKLFEYMAMEKCIIASDLEQIGDILTHNVNAWLIEPGNKTELMNGLKELVDNPELRKKLAIEARKEALKKYTWQVHTQRIFEKLKERCVCG